MKSLLFFSLLLVLVSAKAQPFLEPIVGYSTDLNNSQFRQISVAVQLVQESGEKSAFVLRLQAGLPIKYVSSSPAFSSNPQVPLQVDAEKRISPFSLAFLPGWRLPLGNSKGNNRFFAVPMAGLKFERVDVSYNYDKTNYTILNPDKTLNKLGVVAAFSIEYMHLLKNGRIFTALQAVSPFLGSKNNYPASFRSGFPLSLQLGYTFHISKKTP